MAMSQITKDVLAAVAEAQFGRENRSHRYIVSKQIKVPVGAMVRLDRAYRPAVQELER